MRPSLPPPEDWVPLLRHSYECRQFSNFGPLHQRLEDALTARYCQPGRRAVLASSATSAITATLMALEVEGDVVIPSFTFPATLQAVRQAGCRPLILDVDAETWELSPADVRRQVGRRRLGAILPVRAFGLCRDFTDWTLVGRELGVPVIIDAAAALGGMLDTGAPVGNQGTVEVFSLHATKVFGAGEGGVAVLQEELATRFRSVINFGMPAEPHLPAGFNGKLSEFHSAVGLAMLDRIDDHVAHRNQVTAAYQQRFASLDALTLPARGVGLPPWQAFPILLPEGLTSTDFVRTAHEHGMEVRPYYRPALHEVVERTGGATSTWPTSAHLSEHMVCLPVYSDMSTEEAEAVMETTEIALAEAMSAAQSP